MLTNLKDENTKLFVYQEKIANNNILTMLEIKPIIQQNSSCPHCQTDLKSKDILWQGMHVCVNSRCPNCEAKIVEDLRVSHAIKHSYQIDLDKKLLFGSSQSKQWLGEPLFNSLQNPQENSIEITQEIFQEHRQVIILNCIDFLYGHCLLKLLNVHRHLQNQADYGLIVIIPKLLRWMVPEGVAEIWVVDISLKNSQTYYKSIEEFVNRQLERFGKVYISKAYSHPSNFNITDFTRIEQHNLDSDKFKITFIWREDRIWINPMIAKILKKVKLQEVALFLQNRKIQRLFRNLKFKLTYAEFAVVGLGTTTKFPDWIQDIRVNKFDETQEKIACQYYRDSRLVIGIHGSNMLIPSAHAGMTIDLMPKKRWGNFAQDIIYQEKDPRMAAYKYRYLPANTAIEELTDISISMIVKYSEFIFDMQSDKNLV